MILINKNPLSGFEEMRLHMNIAGIYISQSLPKYSSVACKTCAKVSSRNNILILLPTFRH